MLGDFKFLCVWIFLGNWKCFWCFLMVFVGNWKGDEWVGISGEYTFFLAKNPLSNFTQIHWKIYCYKSNFSILEIGTSEIKNRLWVFRWWGTWAYFLLQIFIRTVLKTNKFLSKTSLFFVFYESFRDSP